MKMMYPVLDFAETGSLAGSCPYKPAKFAPTNHLSKKVEGFTGTIPLSIEPFQCHAIVFTAVVWFYSGL